MTDRGEQDRAVAAKRRLAARTRERDEARRQLKGATVRLESATAQLEAAQQELARVREQVAGLEARLAAVDDEVERAVQRERRRHESRVEQLQQELTDLRRDAHDRARAERDREAAEQAAASRAAARRTATSRRRRQGADAAGLAAPGRPSEFPPDVAPGTTAHALALLGPGRRVLVDGHNVARTVRADLDTEAARRKWLLDASTALAGRRGVAIELFFDGVGDRPEPAQRVGPLLVQYSPGGIDADDELVFAVEASEPDEPLVVVTDDRELRDRLVAHRVDLLGTREFGWALRG